MRKTVAWLVLLLLVGTGGWQWIRVVRSGKGPHPTPAPPSAPAPKPFPGVTLKGVNMLRLANDQGKVQWEIRAHEILLPKHNAGITLVRGLQGATYFHDEKRKLTISAKSLRYNPVTKNLEIIGDVTVTGYENLTVTCDLVRWIAARQQVVCPGEVEAFMKQFSFRTRRVEIYPAVNRLVCPNAIHLVAGTALVQGRQLTANLETETVDMEGPIVMKARVGEGKKPFIL